MRRRFSKFSDPLYNTHTPRLVENKCPCLYDDPPQDWSQTPRNSYPLLKEERGLIIPHYDAPNVRHRLFVYPMTVPPERAKRMPGRPQQPSGSASLYREYHPKIKDKPKWGADWTGQREYRVGMNSAGSNVETVAEKPAYWYVPWLLLGFFVYWLLY